MNDDTTRRTIRCPKCSEPAASSELAACQKCHRVMCRDCFGPLPVAGQRPICKACLAEKTLTA